MSTPHKPFVFILIVCLGLLLASAASATTWYVSVTGNDVTGTGTISNPFRTVMRAVNAAAGHDRILIGPGTYEEYVRVFAKELTLESQDPANPAQLYSDTSRCLNVSDSPGLTVYNLRLHGELPAIFSTNGGAVLVYNSVAIFRRCVIADSRATMAGGGIYTTASSGVIIDSCEIRNNRAVWDSGPGGGLVNMGGGIYIDGSYAVISNCTIADNYCGPEEGYGGGVAVRGNHTTIRNSVISGNTAEALTEGISTGYESEGGGIYIDGDTSLVYSNVIFGNQTSSRTQNTGARSFGGGVLIFGVNNRFDSNFVYDNLAYAEYFDNGPSPYCEAAGGGIYLQGVSCSNNTVDGNTAMSKGILNSAGFYCEATGVAVGGGAYLDNCVVRYNIFTFNEVLVNFDISATCNPLCQTYCERSLIGGAGVMTSISTGICNFYCANEGAPQWEGNIGGTNYNVDPLYCDRINHDYSVAANSPALPGNNSCGVLGPVAIGAGKLGCESYLLGDPNGDLLANVADAVFLINFVFKGGQAPDPYLSGDANCDGLANIADAVYLINYVFKGGPGPGCD